MAQFRKDQQVFLPQEKTIFEVNMLSTPDGTVVSNTNPLPVTLGDATVEITSNNVNVSVPNTISVNSSSNNPVHVHITQMGGVDLDDTATYLPIGGNVNVSGYVTSTIVSNVANPVYISGNVIATQVANTASLVKFIDDTNTQLDVTQRLRVATTNQQWWYTPSVDKDGDFRFVEKFTGTLANSSYIQNLAVVSLTSGTDSNGQAIRISRRRHKMLPGVSILFSAFVGFNGPVVNATKRVGLFTSFNGVFFEVTDDLYLVIRRRLVDGTLVEKRIARSQFSHDKLDGTGATGFNFGPVNTVANTQTLTVISSNLTSKVSNTTVTINSTLGYYAYNVVFACDDTSKFDVGDKVTVTGVTPSTFNRTTQIVAKDASNITLSYIYNPGAYSSMSSAKISQDKLHFNYQMGLDFNGSRSSRVRFFIESKEGATIIHTEDFAGDIGTGWSNAPALPTRIEITNTGAITGLPTMTLGSETINVEAEAVLNPGFGSAYSTSNVTIAKADAGEASTIHPILGYGLRIGEPYQRADAQIQGILLTDLGNVNVQNSSLLRWFLYLNPTIGGSVPTPVNIGKASQQWNYTVGNSISGGVLLLSGYSQATSLIDVKTALNFLNMGSNADNTGADFVVLAVQQLVQGTNDAKIVGTLNFIESL
jgi:hypothetical protein